MATLSNLNFTTYCDKMMMAMQRLRGNGTVESTGQTFGAGDASQVIGSDWGYSQALRYFELAVLAIQDYTLVSALLPSCHNMQLIGDYRTHVQTQFNAPIQALQQVCNAAGLPGVSTIDTFATYYNTLTGGPYTGLVSPDFATIYNLVFGTNMTPWNVYAAAITNMGVTTMATALTISTVSNTTPPTVTVTGTAPATGTLVLLNGIATATSLNGGLYSITNTGANTFTLQSITTGANIAAAGAGTGGTAIAENFIAGTTVPTASQAGAGTITATVAGYGGSSAGTAYAWGAYRDYAGVTHSAPASLYAAIASGHYWVSTAAALSANGTWALYPNTNGDLMTAVAGAAVSGGIVAAATITIGTTPPVAAGGTPTSGPATIVPTRAPM